MIWILQPTSVLNHMINVSSTHLWATLPTNLLILLLTTEIVCWLLYLLNQKKSQMAGPWSLKRKQNIAREGSTKVENWNHSEPSWEGLRSSFNRNFCKISTLSLNRTVEFDELATEDSEPPWGKEGFWLLLGSPNTRQNPCGYLLVGVYLLDSRRL